MPSQADWDKLEQEYMQEEMKNFKYNKGTARMIKIMIAIVIVFGLVILFSLGVGVFMSIANQRNVLLS